MNEYKITMPEGWKPRAHNNCDFCKKDLVCHKHFGICPLSHAVPVKEVEPLAVLADRKGVSFEVCPPSFYVHNVGVWDIGIGEPKKGLYTSFEASTYADCEAKALAYLERLDDKGGR